MGYGGYSHDAHQAFTNARADLPKQQVFTQTACHALMNPKGVRLRESRDSPDHPNSIGVVFALTSAYAFSRFEFPLKKAGLATMLISQMFPAVVTAVPLLFLLDALGLFGTTAGLVLIYATSSVPFSIWMLKGYFDQVPRDLDEAARLDGASSWTIFTRVLLPLVRPGIGITALFSFMTAYNEFVMASVFLDDVSRYTLPVTLQQSVGGFDPSWGVFAAGSLVLSIPIVVLFFFVQRQMTEGLTAGAVKG